MRVLSFVLLGSVTALLSAPRPGEALPYRPWCSVYYDQSTAVGCAYDTYEQCQATISGIGGLCHRNPLGSPDAEAVRAKRGHSRNH
jgi:hypothetical protein